jgi:hypothetical protein
MRIANTPERTGKDGSVTISTRIETGTKLTILADPPIPDKLTSDPIAAPASYPLTLAPGERSQVDLKVDTAPHFCADGKIVRAGAPIESEFTIQEANFIGTPAAVRLRGKSGPDGKYRACGLTPGAYRIATEEGFADFTVSGSDVPRVDV